jgi:hypothetical protein
MKVLNRASLSPEQFSSVEAELGNHRSLLDVIKWARRQPQGTLLPEIIADLIVQDEFTHDIVVPWRDRLYIVYGST